MLKNKNVTIERKNDTVVHDINSYVFELKYKDGYLDFENLVLKDKPGAGFESKYILMLNKSDFLLSKMIMPNGPTGTISRTFENLDFDYKLDENIWTGEHLPTEYKKITFDQYFKDMQAKMSSKSDDELSEKGDKNIKNWKIPNLENNKLVDFSKFEGSVVLLEFWFKFCAPCVKAIPQLNSINKKYKTDNFLFYGVEFREDFPKENLDKYVSNVKMNYPTLYKGKKLAASYSIQAAPTFMIIDKKGTIIYLESGFDNEKIQKIIKENL